MASANGQTPDSVIAALRAEPYAFDFYAAARLLQRLFPDRPRIGYSRSPAEDPIRFGQSPALDFAPATLEACRQKEPQRPPVVYCRHFGLFGPNGPLPLCLTEYARDRALHHGDVTFAAFCNVFHHRLLPFFFRAWADAQKAVDFDRPEEQHWTHLVASLIGLGTGSLLGRDSVPDRAKLFFAGRLVQQSRNAEGLEAILQEFFGIRTEVWTFAGRWLELPGESVCRLGASSDTGTLGASVIVGSRIWTSQLHFHIRMGPMTLSECERLLPTGRSFRRLCDWIRQYAGDQYSWDARLILAKEEVPMTSLGRAGRLGWTTWTRTQPFDHDAEDLLLRPPVHERTEQFAYDN
jgi:type VI secretion system protein ImpH